MAKKNDKQKMATIGEIYSRIVWDANLNRNTFIAGFHERVSDEIREKPLAQWHDNSDIPWHRIRYIRCGETVVWDRDLRIDLFSSNDLPAMAWKSLDRADDDRTDTAALVANNRGNFQWRDIYQYDRNCWQVAEHPPKSIALDRPLKVITYNILSDIYEVDKIYCELRWQLLLTELDRIDADIIALQEVTPTSLAAILATDWVRESYYISASPTGDNVKPYGNVLLSRWHFELVEHQFSAHKRVLVGSWQINDRAIHLANVHLTSDRGENFLQKRDRQLATVVNHLQTLTGDRFIVGDFNVRDNQLTEIINYGNFHDLWCDAHPNAVGYTFDPDRNSLAMLMSLEGTPARFDRMLWKTDRQQNNTVKSIELLGTQPTIFNQIECFPSDHFGLCAQIDFSDKKLANLDLNLNLDLTAIDPVYESIIAIIPPDDIQPSIQAIRQQFDRGFIRILPHITLLYGFVPDRYFDLAVDKIAPILAQLKPFNVSLTEFDLFTHHQTATAWLRPVVTPDGALHELQAALSELFPQCYEQSTKTAAGFNPHLSVGQFDSVAEARAKLPAWHPLKFTVDRVALLSRRREESCVIRQVVGIGKQLPKVANSYELEEIIFAIEPELTMEDRSRQQIGLDLITQACTAALGFSTIVHRLGSARLGIGSTNSDVDLACAIPDYVSGTDFLDRVANLLDGLADRIQVVNNAKFPVLRLEIEGISYDLLYTQVSIDRLDLINNITTAGKVKNISDLLPSTDLPPSIAGCWEADIILDRVGANLPISCFQTLLTAVRAWAKVRGIYGNSWGFLGGFSWSLLCAHTCINYRDRDRSLEALLTHFFELMSQHDPHRVIAITDVGKFYPAKLPQDLMPIVSSIAPCKNTARNITPSTARILQAEFTRGAVIIQNIQIGKNTWQNLYSEVDRMVDCSHLLTISIETEHIETRRQLGDRLIANIIGLIIELDRLGCHVRPYPQIDRQTEKWNDRLGLDLPSDIPLESIVKLTNSFLDRTIVTGDLSRNLFMVSIDLAV